MSRAPWFEKAGWIFIGFALAVGFMAKSQDSGLSVHFEVGRCKHEAAKDGTFYQSNLQTNNQLQPSCFSLGLGGQFNALWGWKVAYHDFGTIRARDNHVTQRDVDAFKATASCNPSTKEGCTARMDGEGKNTGLSLALTRRVQMDGFQFVGEGGLLFFSSKFHAWAVAEDTGNVSYVDEHSPYSRVPALMGGVGVQWKQLYLMVRKAKSLGHREQSLTDHSLTQIVVGVQVPL